MDTETKNGVNLKIVFRIAVSFMISIVSAKIVFIIFWSITLFPGISDSSFIPGIIISTGLIVGILGGIVVFKKIFIYL